MTSNTNSRLAYPGLPGYREAFLREIQIQDWRASALLLEVVPSRCGCVATLSTTNASSRTVAERRRENCALSFTRNVSPEILQMESCCNYIDFRYMI